MKITKIEVKNYRGFPGPCVYTFDLRGGNNLLLYGENGSGKSSLYHALDRLFNIDIESPAFDANLFAKDGNGHDVTDGHVTVHLDGPPPVSLTWHQDGTRLTEPVLVDAASRKGFLEYRSLLRTNFVEGSLDERLFSLAVEVLLVNIPVPIGGATLTLGELWKRVRRPRTHHSNNLAFAESAINDFNQAVRAVLPEIQQKASELLDHFADHHLRLHLEFDGLMYDRSKREIQNQALHLSIEYNGLPIQGHETLLNESRLSALALALYLASVLLSNPAPGPSVPSPLKLLVLDDVLIGLDLSNRLPLLEILDRHFLDYQIILTTYDRVWFEMAHLQTLDGGHWVYAELFSRQVGDPGYEVPYLKTGQDYIQQAKAHYNSHDYMAAAVYARAAFETRLKNFCENRQLSVRYYKDARQISSQDLWSTALQAKKRDGTLIIDSATKSKIETLRKIVLNPLSHAGASSITRAEVGAAIQAVQGLQLR